MSRKERAAVWILCLMAGARVFFFAAAFPFFNNVDEQAHFDLVLKYSHGNLPGRMVGFSPESIPYFVQYGTPEFFLSPEDFQPLASPKLAPLIDEIAAAASPAGQRWNNAINAEAWQPPFYYSVAGLWLNLGRCFGFSGFSLLYWLRFLNVFLAGMLVWLGWYAARELSPKEATLRLCLPTLLAFIPQDMFYGVENDVLSPLCFGVAFICLIRWWRSVTLEFRLAFILGLSISATYLTKVSNVPLLSVALVVVVLKTFSAIRSGNWRAILPRLGVLAACIVIPCGVWIAWMQHAFGDPTGSEAHIELFGWTRKPFTEWWSHPIFTWCGGGDYVWNLFTSFWRGEFIWHGKRLVSFGSDFFYVISSVGLIVVAAVNLPGLGRTQRDRAQIILMGLLSLVVSVAFLVLTSIRFDFGNDFYPSRAQPYLWSGRLISGTLIPFALLYIYGLERVLRWTHKTWAPLVALIVIAIAVTVSEIHISRAVFASPYNLFHLLNPGAGSAP